MDNKVIQNDILRYKKNKLASSLALLGVIFDALYLMLFYSINDKSFYILLIGVSVIVNLLVLLFGFFASEGIKNYNIKFCPVLIVLAVIQIVRIFILPLRGLKGEYLTGHYFGVELKSGGMFTILLIYLVASAACFVLSAVYGFLIAMKHDKHVKAVESGEIDMDKVLEEAEVAAGQELHEVQISEESVPEEVAPQFEEVTPEEEDNNG